MRGKGGLVRRSHATPVDDHHTGEQEMAQQQRGGGSDRSGPSDSDAGRDREVKGLTDDPTGRADIGGPDVPGTGTGGGTGTTGNDGDAGGMGADLGNAPANRDETAAEDSDAPNQ